MKITYRNFIKRNIDLSVFGIDLETRNERYFCTPKGANIIGWTGVDGVHYCLIRGFEEMVFAVSPMSTSGNYVHPVAKNFEDFLRLLLACGNEAALAQVCDWEQAEFDSFLLENPMTEEQKNVINTINEQTSLTAMQSAFAYMKELQAGFDYSQIKYTEDFYDPDMNEYARLETPEWKVFFEGDFWGHSGRDRAGKEIPIGKHFQWAGHDWLIPAVYTCGKGLVVDFCMQVDSENPECFDYQPTLVLNGKELVPSHGCGISYHPCPQEGMGYDIEAKWVVEHYGLDTSCGWMIWRSAFPWKTKRRTDIKTLSVTMEQQLVSVPGPHFRVSEPGDSVQFIYPTTGMVYTLAVEEYEQQEMQKSCFDMLPDQEFPTHYTAMSYTVTPELPDGTFTVQDCVDSDSPRLKKRNPMEPEVYSSVACIGIIGGADGPTSVNIGEYSTGRKRAACSALHFEPEGDVEWQIVFHEKQFDDITIKLMDLRGKQDE